MPIFLTLSREKSSQGADVAGETKLPYRHAYYGTTLFGEVYQYAIIPRGIAACNKYFTFYQKKLLEPNPGKPRQIMSYQKFVLIKFCTFFQKFGTLQRTNGNLAK